MTITSILDQLGPLHEQLEQIAKGLEETLNEKQAVIDQLQEQNARLAQNVQDLNREMEGLRETARKYEELRAHFQ